MSLVVLFWGLNLTIKQLVERANVTVGNIVEAQVRT
jgi:hypothetical protein